MAAQPHLSLNSLYKSSRSKTIWISNYYRDTKFACVTLIQRSYLKAGGESNCFDHTMTIVRNWEYLFEDEGVEARRSAVTAGEGYQSDLSESLYFSIYW